MMTCPNWFLELWQTFGPAAGWIAFGLLLYQWFKGKHGHNEPQGAISGSFSQVAKFSRRSTFGATPSAQFLVNHPRHGLEGASSLPMALVVAVLCLLAVGIAAFASLES